MLNLDHSDRNCINNWIPRNTAFGIVRRRCSKIVPAVAIGPRLNNHPSQYCTISNFPRPDSQCLNSPCTNGASPAIKDAERGNVVVELCFRALVV